MKPVKALVISSLVSILLMTITLSIYLLLSVQGAVLDKLITLIYMLPTFFGIMTIFYAVIFLFCAPIIYKVSEYYAIIDNSIVSFSLVLAFVIAATSSGLLLIFAGGLLKSLFLLVMITFIIPFNVRLFLELKNKKK